MQKTYTFDALEWLGAIRATAAYNTTTIKARNDAIDAANARLPEGATPAAHVPDLTTDEYVAARAKDVLSSWTAQYRTELAGDALAVIFALPAEQQAAILTAMGLDDLLAIADPVRRAARIQAVALPAFLALPRETQNQLAAMVYPELA